MEQTSGGALAVRMIDESKIGAFVTKPYAEQLRTAFPNATFVGFTGTPIAETIQVFGDIVDRYTMQQAVDDDITKDIKYIPRIAKVTLDSQKSQGNRKTIMPKCAEEGATETEHRCKQKGDECNGTNTWR